MSDSIIDLVQRANGAKTLFTPGPAAITKENLEFLGPCFGRNDAQYDVVEDTVLNWLKVMSGQENIVRLQGSGTLANEIAINNFVGGKVVVVDSGYYSDRLLTIAENLFASNQISDLKYVKYENLENLSEHYDWVIAVSTETSKGLLRPIEDLHVSAKKLHAKLLIDAVASIGLEENHGLADVICFSSCKGLFGLTGAAFVGFSVEPKYKPRSVYLDLYTHFNKGVTGPYHVIQSLYGVIPMHEDFVYSVRANKMAFLAKFEEHLVASGKNQPLLCTAISKKLELSEGSNGILYSPRNNFTGSIVSHLGEINLGRKSQGTILNQLCLKEG